MTAPNHIVGGLTFTGIFASFTAVNILEKPSYIIIVIVASLLPDIDHTRSTIGKMLFPLAKWLNKHYGHRTITHTLLFLAAGTIITATIERSFLNDHNYSKLFFFAYLSHLIFDMMTVQGVPLFYPFNRNPCVLPANPDKRFRTGNIRTETLLFSIFTLSAVFCYPMMQNGFWMQYNRQFGTLTHLAKQYKLSENILEVTFSYREGSTPIEGTGLCIEATKEKSIILENGRFIELTPKLTALKIFPTETKQSLIFQTESFNEANISEVEQLMGNGALAAPLKSIHISANKKFIISKNGIHQEVNTIKENYPSYLRLKEITEKPAPPFKFNPRILQLQKRIVHLRQIDQDKKAIYQQKIQHINQLKQQLETATIIEKENLLTQLRTKEKQLKHPKLNEERIEEIQLELASLRQEQAIEREIYNEENQTEALQLTGTLTKIIIQ